MKIQIVGAGPGDISFMSKKALDAVLDCDLLIGGKRNLEPFLSQPMEKLEITNNLEFVLQRIKNEFHHKKIVVLASGSPFFYGIGAFLCEKLFDMEIEIISGISSLSYFASKLHLKEETIFPASVHGKNADLRSILSNHQTVALFTGKQPESILKNLDNLGFGQWKAVIGENLSYPQEKITFGTIASLKDNQYSDLTIFILEKPQQEPIWPYQTGAIEDSLFIRGQVPMTKEEIRVLSISKLKLKPNSRLWDIGSGTGSIAVESSGFLPEGSVYAVEKNPEAIALIRENKQKFHRKNIDILEGDALSILKNSGIICDRAFLGGTDGQMEEVLEYFSHQKAIRIVINTITIESSFQAVKLLEQYHFTNLECIQVNIAKSKKVGKKHLMMAHNPVTIISAQRGLES